MEGEAKNFILVWLTVLASLYYSHTIAKFIPKGTIRFLTIFPIICLFLYLPLNLNTVILGSTSSFFISWLATFKLLLFAFGKGPLSSNSDPPISFPLFILIACLPIKFNHHNPPIDTKTKKYPSHQTTQNCLKSPQNYATKALLLAMVFQVYKYKEHVHPKIILLLYGIHIYITLEFLLAMMASIAQAVAKLELEPQFDEPYLATSLQDFWGRRWNLIVASILRPTVYDPVRSNAIRLIGRKWASLPAVLATFLVSGLMHEVILYHVGKVRPTGMVMCFFLLHGVCLVLEICLKKALNGRFSLPVVVSGPLVVLFVVVTGSWLFIMPIVQCKIDIKSGREAVVLLEFVKGIVRHSSKLLKGDVSSYDV